MNKLKLSIVFLLLIAFATSCSDEETLPKEKNVTLKFKTEKKSNDFFELDANIVSYNPVRLESEFLREVHTVDIETGEEVYGYVLIDAQKSNEPVNPSLIDIGSIETGYFFDGECFVYGYLITYSNGHHVFSACGYDCIGLDDICPGEGEAYV